MAKVITDNGIGYALFGGGLLGFEIGAGLAARLGAGVTMEVTQVNVDGGKLVAERPILGDSSISESRYKDKGIIIGRLNAFEPKETGGSATVGAFPAWGAFRWTWRKSVFGEEKCTLGRTPAGQVASIRASVSRRSSDSGFRHQKCWWSKTSGTPVRA